MDGCNIGVMIGRLRTDASRDWSQQDLSDKIKEITGKDISREKIKNWENGERMIKAEDVIVLSKCFGVSADYLLGLARHPSIEGDQRESAEYTGLTENAVQALHEINRFENTTFLETLSSIITDADFFDLIEQCTTCIRRAKMLETDFPQFTVEQKVNEGEKIADSARYSLYDLNDILRGIINHIYPVDETIRKARKEITAAKEDLFDIYWDEGMREDE